MSPLMMDSMSGVLPPFNCKAQSWCPPSPPATPATDDDGEESLIFGAGCLNGAVEVGAALLLHAQEFPPSSPRLMDSQEFDSALAGLQAAAACGPAQQPPAPACAGMDTQQLLTSCGSWAGSLQDSQDENMAPASGPATTQPVSRGMRVRVVLKSRQNSAKPGALAPQAPPACCPPPPCTDPCTDAGLACSSLLNNTTHSGGSCSLGPAHDFGLAGFDAPSPQPSNSCGSSPSSMPCHVAVAAAAAGAPMAEHAPGQLGSRPSVRSSGHSRRSLPRATARRSSRTQPLQPLHGLVPALPTLPPVSFSFARALQQQQEQELKPELDGNSQLPTGLVLDAGGFPHAGDFAAMDLAASLPGLPSITTSGPLFGPQLPSQQQQPQLQHPAGVAQGSRAALLQPMPAKRKRLQPGASLSLSSLQLPAQQQHKQQDPQQRQQDGPNHGPKRARRGLAAGME